MDESRSKSFKQAVKIVEKVSIKYGAKDWEEFDRLEQASQSSSDRNRLNPNKPHKPTRKERKTNEINQYQKALIKLRSANPQFCNPFQQQKLNIQYMPVLKMLEQAYEQEIDLQIALKKTGLKTSKMLFKTGSKINIWFMLKYIRDTKIPDWVIQRHRQMMRKSDDEFNKSDQNTLLRTMSANSNTCLKSQM